MVFAHYPHCGSRSYGNVLAYSILCQKNKVGIVWGNPFDLIHNPPTPQKESQSEDKKMEVPDLRKHAQTGDIR